MAEYECATVPIEKEEALSAPSTRCHEDFEVEGGRPVLAPACGRIAASAVLAFATYSVALGGLGPARTFVASTNSVVVERAEAAPRKSISLFEACRIARELQNRVDAEYQSLLESEAQVSAVWEEEG